MTNPSEILLKVKVSPKASRNAISGWHQDALKISVTAVPDKGKANDAVLKLLAKTLGVPRSACRIVRGDTQREKLIGIMADEAVLQELPSAGAAGEPAHRIGGVQREREPNAGKAQ